MSKRKISKSIHAMDVGTIEMHRKFNIVPKLSDPTTLAMKIMDGSEVDRMLMNDSITAAEHGTLMVLTRRLQKFGFMGLRSPAYDSPVHADPELVADKKATVIRGAVSLIDRMDKHPAIGKARRQKLINLVLEDVPWGKLRHQIEDVRHCIRALDDLFLSRT